MTDYEKLRGFALELNPNGKFGKNNTSLFKYNDENCCWFYRNKEENVSIYINGIEFGLDNDGDKFFGYHKDTRNIDKLISDAREYWTEKGLLKPKKTNKGKDETRKYYWTDESTGELLYKMLYKTYDNIEKEVLSPFTIQNVKDELLGTKYLKETNNKKSIMQTIKNSIKTFKLSDSEKAHVDAGLMDINKNYTSEVRELALEELIDEKIARKEFQETLDRVAKERNEKDCK